MNTPGRHSAALLCAVALLFAAPAARALPRFALQTGLACSSCHVSAGGGGMRNEGGWNTMKTFSLVSPKGTFLERLFDRDDNAFFSERVFFGFDFRTQVAYRHDAAGAYKRQLFTMQIAPYVSYRPVDAVEIVASYNFVKPEWPSQQRVLASVIVRPSNTMSIEAGLLQPDFGVRNDDHTTFTRSEARIRPFSPELGALASAEPFEWLNVSAGVYGTKNRSKEYPLADGSPLIRDGSVMGSGRINTHWSDFDMGLSTNLGASVLLTDGQTLASVQAGIGLIDRASLLAEFVRWENGPEGETYKPTGTVYSIGAAYELLDGLSLTARYEESRRKPLTDRTDVLKQYVVGAQIFVVPFVELRPEYRWTDTPSVTIAQWTGQLHVFW